MESDRFARQILAFGKEGQRKIESAPIGIVGLGGIGSQIAQGLAYLGVTSFVLIDHDFVDHTNLNRLIGASPGDAETEVLKVTVAEEHIRKINPKATVQTIAKSMRSMEAFETLIYCPIVFGCVDNDSTRLILTELTAAYELILIDSATEIFTEDGNISEFGGRVVVARPGDFCLVCSNQIDMEVAKQELETTETRELRKAHGYGLNNKSEAPSVVSLNGIIANIAITEFLVMVTGIREPCRYLVYHGLRGNVNIRDDKRKSDCYTCGYLKGIRDQANITRYIYSD